MPDKPTTEEHTRVEHIAKRWRRRRRCIFCIFAYIFVVDIPHYLPLPTCLDPLWLVILISMSVFFTRRAARRFVKRLGKEDRLLITQYAETDPRFRHLIKVCKIDAEKEYLRASQQPSHDTDTLLRAATPHRSDTAPDQLLRPSDEK